MTDAIRQKYQPTIGIECHVQLKTQTKLFTGVNNDARGAEPNTLVSPLCFGLPGTLPVLNKQAVELGIKAGIALNAEIAELMKFDRKHYFYPDLPKGYQITQFDQPIIREGYVDIPLRNLRGAQVDAGQGADEQRTESSMKDEEGAAESGTKTSATNGGSVPGSARKQETVLRVRVERAHLEEDAGKSTHPSGADYSLVDLNRAGTPLLEIVSRPDMHSAEDARAYAQELYNVIKYAGVSDVDLYHGNMRFDVNVSVAPTGDEELGTRSEVKNLNSFRSVERATEFEINRQIELIEKGGTVVQETRGWDDAKQKTTSQRTKEEAHDYRYFPEPDLPPTRIDRSWVQQLENNMPKLPAQIRSDFAEAGVQPDHIETIIAHPQLAHLITATIAADKDAPLTKIVNWLVVDVMAEVNANEDFDWAELKLSPNRLIELEKLVKDGALSSNGATTVIKTMMYTGDSAEDIAKEKELLQTSDTGEIEKIVDDVIAANEKAAEDVRGGEMKAIGFLVGQVMQKSKGQANPQIAKDLLMKKLSE